MGACGGSRLIGAIWAVAVVVIDLGSINLLRGFRNASERLVGFIELRDYCKVTRKLGPASLVKGVKEMRLTFRPNTSRTDFLRYNDIPCNGPKK
jgi:hypothetical protein